MRADRLLTIMLLLQKHQQMTAQSLAEQLGVSERTIYRDIEALSLAGVPVYTRTGPDGGCFLDEHYRTSLNWFTGNEIQALLYTTSATPLAELGLAHAVDNAVLKLLSLLPERYQQESEKMRQRLYLDPSGWYGNTDATPALPLLKDAVWQDRLIDANYENWEGQQKHIQLAPYSLVYKSDRWYLVAQHQQSGKMRTYRLARLCNVQLLTTKFERDAEFDIATYWQMASEQFINRVPEYPVTLRIRPKIMVYFQRMMSGRYHILEQATDWIIVHVAYTVFEEARTSILGLGIDAEVIEPQALHDAILNIADAITAKYSP